MIKKKNIWATVIENYIREMTGSMRKKYYHVIKYDSIVLEEIVITFNP